MLILSASDQKSVLCIEEAIDAVGEALTASSLGRTLTPIRTHLPVSTRGTALFMPSFVEPAAALGVKFVSVFPGNQRLGKETIYGVMVLADAETSEPLALLEASYLTALRTGAAAGLATRHLSRKSAHVLAVIGTGAQSRSIIAATLAVRDIQEIWLYNRTREKARQLERELVQSGALGAKVFVADSPDDAVRRADIIVTATNSYDPVFQCTDFQPGVHINAIGSYRPDMQELPLEVFRLKPKVVVESRDAAFEETGDLISPVQEGLFSKEQLHAELGDIVCGTATGRQSEHELTIFKSVGLACMDVVVAKKMFDKAIAEGFGTKVDLT